MNAEIQRLNKGFIQVSDPKIWVGTFVPFFVSVVMAKVLANGFNIYWTLLSLAGVCFIEVGVNALNESIDYIFGADRVLKDDHKTPFSGGKRAIVDGVISVKESAIFGALGFAAAGIIGLIVVFFREPAVLYFGGAGFILAVMYSLPPFKLCYRGFGEIAVGIIVGPMIMVSVYMVIANEFNILPLLVSIPMGLIITDFLFVNQFPDYEADKAVNKRNWVVRLGKEKAITVFGMMYVLTYASIVAIAVYTSSIVWLIGLLTIPMAYKAYENGRRNLENIENFIKSNDLTIKIYMLEGVLMSIATIIYGMMR